MKLFEYRLEVAKDDITKKYKVVWRDSKNEYFELSLQLKINMFWKDRRI